MRTGTVMALTQTATGNVFAAYVAPAAIDAALVATFPDGSQRSAAKKTLASLAPDFARVRERGLARAQGHPVPGINAFSAPVFDHSGEIALAVTVLGSAPEFDVTWTSEVASQVKLTAHSISQRLGHRK
jgi:DNA-binding IclR family transcriptional regulator